MLKQCCVSDGSCQNIVSLCNQACCLKSFQVPVQLGPGCYCYKHKISNYKNVVLSLTKFLSLAEFKADIKENNRVKQIDNIFPKIYNQ